MMTILHRYIAKTVILATLLVLMVVVGLTYFINFLGELRDIGSGDYGVLQAALHALLELPNAAYQFFPMLVLLGGLLGLGILASQHELVIMRASGVSIGKIIRAVFGAAFVLIVIGLLIGELIAPRAHYLADKRKSIAQNGGQAVVTSSGVWLHQGNNFIHLDRVMTPEHLEGVTRYEFDAQHHLLAAYYAKSLDFTGGKWVLRELDKTTFTNDQSSSQHSAEATWDLVINPTLLSVGTVEPSEMPLNQLSNYTHHLVKNGLEAKEFQFSFWKRVFQPLTILIMLFLAVPFVFVAPRSVTMGWRMLTGVMVGFVFYILNALLGQISIVFQLSPIAAALLPILSFAGLGYVLMARIRN